ncbi:MULTISPECIES: hypothetical protein [Streptomyces]|uniref:hypothetical protein n=1 Tax=Streptomyces TaxID=1883 RepID=UPI001F2FA467|nr:hypothetical protein [Streptomyces olivochromogenes]
MSGTSIKRVSTVAGLAAAAVLAAAPGAWANWSSYINSWTDGDTSRTWADESYSQVQFTGCTAQYATTKQVVVQLWDYDALSSNDYYGSKTFTNCFNGASYTSNGEWTGLPTEPDFYFETSKVGQGGSCCLLNVKSVYVDTTKADS